MASDNEKYSFKDEEIKNLEEIIEKQKNLQKRLEIKKIKLNINTQKEIK